MHSNGLKLSGALEDFSITSQYKKLTFEEIKRFESSFLFYRIEVQVITNLSSRLEKHQTFDILLMTDFF